MSRKDALTPELAALGEQLGFDNSTRKYPEILYDYMYVRALLVHLREARGADVPKLPEAQRALDIAEACLDRVESTSLLQEKWSCINNANAQLALACRHQDELRMCRLRLRNLAPILSEFKDRLHEPFKQFATDAFQVDDEAKLEPHRTFEVLEGLAQGWHLVNEQNALTTLFWQKTLVAVSVLLALAVLATEATNYFALDTRLNLGIPFPYLLASLFGALGGALSALLGARSALVSATTFRVAISQAWVRMLLGGVGAFIFALTIQSGFVFSEDIQKLTTSFAGLALISIAAGFSERLFISALEHIAGTVRKSRAKK